LAQRWQMRWRRAAQSVVRHGRSAAPGVIGADLGEPATAERLWDQALAAAGGSLDVLVNNAGLFSPNPLDVSDIAWLDGSEETLRINLTAAASFPVSRCGIGKRAACRAGWFISQAVPPTGAICPHTGTMRRPRAA